MYWAGGVQMGDIRWGTDLKKKRIVLKMGTDLAKKRGIKKSSTGGQTSVKYELTPNS